MKAFLNWSGGKDSTFCLYKAKQQGLNIDALVTTVSQPADRISMHGVPSALVSLQAASVQLPLHLVSLPVGNGMRIYEDAIHQSNVQLKAEGFTHAASGDLFLEDLKTYRENLYAKDGIHCLFPIWKTDTAMLMREFIDAGFKAIIVSVNGSRLDKSFCGRLIDDSFIHDLPEDVDICGENGEFHSFVFDGPLFTQPVAFTKGDILLKEYPAPKGEDDCFTTPQPPVPFTFATCFGLR